MRPLLSTILRCIKLIPLSVIRERTQRSLRSICAGTHNSGLLPPMKEARIQVYTAVDAGPRNNISDVTRRPLAADRLGARAVCANSFSQFHAAVTRARPEHKREQIIVVPAIIEHSHLINRVRIVDSSRPASGRGNYIAELYRRATNTLPCAEAAASGNCNCCNIYASN